MGEARGEAWVLAQGGLLVGYLLAPRLGGRWPWPLRLVGLALGLPLLATGLTFLGFGLVALRGSLTPFPRPRPGAPLVTSGIYGCVRHPIYGGIVMAAVGAALALGSLSRLLLALVLLGFFGAKSEVEERWLLAQHPEYAAYRARVRRMLPGLW
ncbi:MAG: hypothetical protein KatS3mg061_2340 [Dehalococcoidia bacterium]|nr:MAG: hypothetical protein KatS3mg061_2340 [Dehalococcoidia bacterium]